MGGGSLKAWGYQNIGDMEVEIGSYMDTNV